MRKRFWSAREFRRRCVILLTGVAEEAGMERVGRRFPDCSSVASNGCRCRWIHGKSGRMEDKEKRESPTGSCRR